MTKVHDQLSKILASKTAADGTTTLSPPAAAAKVLAAKLAEYGLPPNACRKFVTQGQECTGHCRFLHPPGKENVIPATPICAREGCSRKCTPPKVVGDKTINFKWCSKECAVAARGAASGRSKDVAAANVVTDTMLEELFTAAIGDSNADAAGKKPMAAVAMAHEFTLKVLPQVDDGDFDHGVDAQLQKAMEVSGVTYSNGGMSDGQISACPSSTLWTATMMSRPAAAVAQAKWASGACITHDDRGEMMLDLYFQRVFCVMMQPATFSGTFGHYDPALACRVTGCLLEYYDDVELDGLSVLQFYGKCDEIIAAIRCLQFRAVSEAYRVEKMDVAAAVFREYLNSTWRSWPRPPPADGGAQAAHGNREFVQFVGSRDFYTKLDVGPTFSDPRMYHGELMYGTDSNSPRAANSFPERSGSVQGVC